MRGIDRLNYHPGPDLKQRIILPLTAIVFTVICSYIYAKSVTNASYSQEPVNYDPNNGLVVDEGESEPVTGSSNATSSAAPPRTACTTIQRGISPYSAARSFTVDGSPYTGVVTVTNPDTNSNLPFNARMFIGTLVALEAARVEVPPSFMTYPEAQLCPGN